MKQQRMLGGIHTYVIVSSLESDGRFGSLKVIDISLQYRIATLDIFEQLFAPIWGRSGSTVATAKL